MTSASDIVALNKRFLSLKKKLDNRKMIKNSAKNKFIGTDSHNSQVSKTIPPYSGPANFDVWVLLDAAHFAISRSRFLEIAQFGLTPEKAQILHVVLINGGAFPQSKISDFTMRQHHSVSSLINRMTKEGLLKKVKYPGDRAYTVLITKKGKDRYSKLTRDSIEMIFSTLSDTERKKLYSILHKVLDRSRNLLGLDYEPPFLKSTNQK
jgi:DNA-binding MarR family transcriptional regulator